jgi:hypothetical protein
MLRTRARLQIAIIRRCTRTMAYCAHQDVSFPVRAFHSGKLNSLSVSLRWRPLGTFLEKDIFYF